MTDEQAEQCSLLAVLAHKLGDVIRRWPGDLHRLAAELRRHAERIERKAQP